MSIIPNTEIIQRTFILSNESVNISDCKNYGGTSSNSYLVPQEIYATMKDFD